MKCRDCDCAKRGWFKSLPDAYVCIGVKEPFVISNYPNAECTEYRVNSSVNDGVYMELFIVKNGVKHNMKTMNIKEASTTLVDSLMDGIEKLLRS